LFNFLGTWSKKSKIISGRRPFVKDTATFNYDFDSEGEWQDEDEGESILESNGETGDEEEEDEAEGLSSEDSWVVPDGYLSEGEGVEMEDLPKELDPFYDPGLDASTDRTKRKRPKKSIRELKISIVGPTFIPLISQVRPDPWTNLESVFCA
jgi:hypothetical protein